MAGDRLTGLDASFLHLEDASAHMHVASDASESKFARVEMKPRYNERVGRIPADKTRAATVQYYIEVRDPNGQIVERSGKATSPNLIFLEKDALPHYYADLGDDRSYHEDGEVEVGPFDGGSRQAEPGRSGPSWSMPFLEVRLPEVGFDRGRGEVCLVDPATSSPRAPPRA